MEESGLHPGHLVPRQCLRPAAENPRAPFTRVPKAPSPSMRPPGTCQLKDSCVSCHPWAPGPAAPPGVNLIRPLAFTEEDAEGPSG